MPTEYEVLEPGGHQAFADAVKSYADRAGGTGTTQLANGSVTTAKLADDVKAGLNTPNEFPALSAGSATGITGDVETASWMARQTNADGAALIESVKGNTLRWNQLIKPNPRSVTSKGVTYTNTSDGKATLDGTATGAETFTSSLSLGVVSGHKYVYRGADVERAVYANIAGIGPNLNSESIYTATSNVASTTLSVSVGATYAGTYECYPQLFDLTAMFGAGNEPATVAEFEALFPEPYYPYDSGSLLPVRMEGVETNGFNQWDEQWEVGGININNGTDFDQTGRIRGKNYIPVFPATTYFFGVPSTTSGNVFFYDADRGFISQVYKYDETFTTPSNCRFIRIAIQPNYGTTYNHDICINLSDPSRNGTYEPYWRSERTIPATDLRSAGSVYDELTEHEAIHRVGVGTVTSHGAVTAGAQNKYAPLNGVNADQYSSYSAMPAGAGWVWSDKLGHTIGHMGSSQLAIGRTWNDIYAYAPLDADDSIFDQLVGATVWYQLATPTTTPIDPPLPLSYRTGAGGTERVMVAEGTTSAPPIFATRYPLDPADLAASIAPMDGPTATTNHQVGDLLMLGFTLCKATQVIVTGEVIEIGTNVTRTTVAAELAALSQ